MKTRPWRYIVAFRHHNNTDCSQPPPKLGRGLIKVWGSGDLPLCTECERLSRPQDLQLEQLARAVSPETGYPCTETAVSDEVDKQRDPD